MRAHSLLALTLRDDHADLRERLLPGLPRLYPDRTASGLHIGNVEVRQVASKHV
jgi:hypothetical protein